MSLYQKVTSILKKLEELDPGCLENLNINEINEIDEIKELVAPGRVTKIEIKRDKDTKKRTNKGIITIKGSGKLINVTCEISI